MIAPGIIPVDSPLALCGVVLLLAFAVRPYTTQATPISVDGATLTLDFQNGNDTNRLSEAAGWSTSDTVNRPDGYVDDSNNTNNLLGFLGGVYEAPSSLSTELTYNFEAGSSNRFVFQWTQNISSSVEAPGDDIFGWRFLSGADTAFSVKFLNDTGPTNDRDLLVQGYNGAGIALTQVAGQPNDWFIDRDDANDFRVTADLATKKWALDVFNKSNSSWFGLVIDASIDPSVTSLNKFAATWTVTATNAAEAGDNIMAFDNITIQGKQTVAISLNIPTNSVYNGSPQTVSPTTVPTGVALIVKYNGSTNVPVNAGTYTVTAELVDTTTYYSAPTSGSLTVAKATPSITSSPIASGITYGQTLADSILSGGSASVAGSFAFTSPTDAPNAGTANQGITFTPSDTANYDTTTGVVSVAVAKATPSITAAPSASSITYGQTLASSILTGGTGSVAGSFAFTTPSTAPAVGTSSQSVTFTPTDTTNYNNATTSVSVTVNSADGPWDIWADSYGLANGTPRTQLADPDGDGFVNALEFAFGTSPVAPNGQVFVSHTKVGSNYVVTFKKRKVAAEVTYDIRQSTDLKQTFGSGTTMTEGSATGVDANYDQTTVTLPISGNRGFVRMQATVNVTPSR